MNGDANIRSDVITAVNTRGRHTTSNFITHDVFINGEKGMDRAKEKERDNSVKR